MKRISSLTTTSVEDSLRRETRRLASLSAAIGRARDLLVISFVLMAMTGCAGLQRSEGSGYAGRDQAQADQRERKLDELRGADEDLGFDPSGPLTDSQQEELTLRSRLAKAERSLEGKREREQYFKNKPYMRNDRDRLEFLAQDSFEDRQRWMNAKGINPTSGRHPADIQYLIDVNDITLGMTKQAVRESWGEPESIEVSGNQIYGNERWHYKEQLESADGYQTQNRYVTFGSGRVIGWESH